MNKKTISKLFVYLFVYTPIKFPIFYRCAGFCFAFPNIQKVVSLFPEVENQPLS